METVGWFFGLLLWAPWQVIDWIIAALVGLAIGAVLDVQLSRANLRDDNVELRRRLNGMERNLKCVRFDTRM